MNVTVAGAPANNPVETPKRRNAETPKRQDVKTLEWRNTETARREDFNPSDPRLAGLHEAANRVIGNVFYGTLLRMLRAGSLKGPYGHGGRGEEVFQAQLDQVLADRAGQARGYTLGRAIVDRLADQQLRVEKRRSAEETHEETQKPNRDRQGAA